MANQFGNQLAVLIGAPHQNQTSMHHDMAAMDAALRQRGIASKDILCLEGRLDRHLLLSFLASVTQRINEWANGTLLFFLSGHGFFSGDTTEEARVGVELKSVEHFSPDTHVFWDEIFQTLRLPASVEMILLPDH